MSKFKRATNTIKATEVESFVNGANERTPIAKSAIVPKAIAPKVSFVLKLDHGVHELLKGLAAAEDRSMQWMLRKMTSEAIKKKASDLGLSN